MGEGTRESQYKSRFGLGESIDTFGMRCLGLNSSKRLQIGEYIIKLGNEGYDLRKGNQLLGTYKEAKLLSDRVLFKLEKGMLLEITPKGIRKILTPAKAGILGFINSDGSLIYNTKTYTYRFDFNSSSDELIGKFDEFINEVYGISMYKYPKKDRDHFISSVRKVIRYGPGDIKWVNLRLYKEGENSECEELENRLGGLNDLKTSLRKNDEILEWFR